MFVRHQFLGRWPGTLVTINHGFHGLQDDRGNGVWLRQHRHMTGVDFADVGLDGFCHGALAVGSDHAILRGNNVPNRPVVPSGNNEFVVEGFGGGGPLGRGDRLVHAIR